MKKLNSVLLINVFIFVAMPVIWAQTPKLYLNFVSHNEPKDSLHKSSEFAKASYWTRQIAAMMQSKGAKYNLQTCDGFLDGALNYESAATLSSDVIQVLDTMANVEIDPRYKTYLPSFTARNYADNAYMISLCGASPTHTLGGFLWYSSVGQPDWFPYENITTSHAYPGHPWQADILYGPGSFPPHTNDKNDFGCWKPDTSNNFYGHNNARHLWLMGNGCAPLLDSSDVEQDVIDLIQGHVDSIQAGYWPNNGFYSATIMINQSNFGPTLYNKLSILIDSINISRGYGIEWKLITEKFTAFQTWQGGNSGNHSQWLCGQIGTGMDENYNLIPSFNCYPNPGSSLLNIELSNSNSPVIIELLDVNSRLITSEKTNEKIHQLNVTPLENGIYFIRIHSKEISETKKVIVQHN